MQARRRTQSSPLDDALDDELFLSDAEDYREAKRREAEAKVTQERLKPFITAYVESHGRKTPEGHLVVDLPTPLGQTRSVVRQFAPDTKFDPSKAMAIADARGIRDQVCRALVVFDADDWARFCNEFVISGSSIEELAKNIVIEVDDDRFFGYHQLHKDVLTPEDIDSCFVTEEKWSLVTQPPGWK